MLVPCTDSSSQTLSIETVAQVSRPAGPRVSKPALGADQEVRAFTKRGDQFGHVGIHTLTRCGPLGDILPPRRFAKKMRRPQRMAFLLPAKLVSCWRVIHRNAQGIRSYLKTLLVLGRVSNLPTVWSNCLAGWWIADGVEARRLFLTMLGGTLLYLGGMFLNDAIDAAYDRDYRPERPIPSGRISLASVWQWGVSWLLLGVFCFGALGLTPFFWALALMSCILLYDVVHKMVVFAPVLMAGCRFLLVLTAGAATLSGMNGFNIWAGLVLALYIIGLSYLARGESRPRTADYWPCVFLLSPVVLALIHHRGPDQWRGIFLSILLLFWIAFSLRHVYGSRQPNIGRGVSGLLAGIVLVDLLAIGAPAPGPTMILILFFALSLLFQRFIPAT